MNDVIILQDIDNTSNAQKCQSFVHVHTEKQCAQQSGCFSSV